MRRLVALLSTLAFAATASAHPLSFGVLELRDENPRRTRVTWRFSGTALSLTGAEVVLPTRCLELGPRVTEPIVDGLSARWSVDCGPDGIAGAEVSVRGLEGSGVQVVARYASADGVSEGLLDDAHRAWEVPSRGARSRVFGRYLALGVEHIATGWDHLAFVLGLALVTRDRRSLLAAITAFTLGHSATLALASLGLAHAPTRAVEAAIAWSIVVVAREAVLHARGGEASRATWATAALFGLLHGFGFAGALAELGLPRGAVFRALLAFNLGVELGQVAFVAAALALATHALRRGVPVRAGRLFVAYVVGVAGASWLALRLAVFVPS